MLKKSLLAIIRIYQKTISPDRGIHSRVLKNESAIYIASNICRFYPTCSDYAFQAIKKKGLFKGLFMAIRRISRCHPFNKGGYDPVE